MKYGMLLKPHANARYQTEAARIAHAELDLMLKAILPDARQTAALSEILPMLEFDVPKKLSDGDIRRLCGHSLCYVLFELHDGGMSIAGVCAKPYLFDDLAGILKYKGKTNEQFTLLTINAALYSSDFWSVSDTRLSFLDPMCARGTALFQAANLGWNACGGDIDKADIRELTQFFKRYLEYHKIKHASACGSSTVPKEKPIPWTEFSYADTAENYRSGNTASLRASVCDCALADSVFGKNRFHVIACDLPYGVQHAPGTGSIEELLRKSAPHWKNALKRGGAISVSFNTNTIKTKLVREIFADCGLDVMSGGAYDGFKHWVEQAVDRDIVVAKRTSTALGG